MTYKKYKNLKPLATEIYLVIKGKPETHEECANSFNITGDIIRILDERIKH